MTRRHRHRDRLFNLGRPRTSTLVLIGLFVGVFALYILVRPVQAPAANVQQANTTPSHQTYVPKTYSPSPTRTPSHSPSPSPRRTVKPSHTPTPTPTTPASSSQPSPTTSPSVTLPGGSPAG
jgi:cytoskeletal protein RodZ